MSDADVIKFIDPDTSKEVYIGIRSGASGVAIAGCIKKDFDYDIFLNEAECQELIAALTKGLEVMKREKDGPGTEDRPRQSVSNIDRIKFTDFDYNKGAYIRIRASGRGVAMDVCIKSEWWGVYHILLPEAECRKLIAALTKAFEFMKSAKDKHGAGGQAAV